MNTDQKQQEEVVSEDNLEVVDVLNDLSDFNTGSSAQPEQANEPEAEQQTETENKSDDEWLIKDKFKNNAEGREKLAKSYREIQSMSDKNSDKYKKLEKLDKFLAENPNVVAAMQNELDGMKQAQSGPPEKPDNYDIFDETREGTVSYEWRQKYDKYLVDQGKSAAQAEVQQLRNELNQEKATKDRASKLQAMGMSEADIKEYDNFINNPDKLTEDTLVDVWRYLNGKTPLQGNNNQNQGTRRTSAAASSGSAPSPASPQDKDADSFFKGIMKHSR
tara:strand:- start:10757 stop:11584 length:828 start_codon:yes stop_codon:yes gene_type:complete